MSSFCNLFAASQAEQGCQLALTYIIFLLSIQVKLQLAFVGDSFPTLPHLSCVYQREIALPALLHTPVENLTMPTKQYN